MVHTPRPSRGAAWAALALATAAVACAPWRAPWQLTPAYVEPDEGVLEIAWTQTSCEEAGYVTVMTSDGTFIGNVGPDTTLRAKVPPGPIELVAWNPVMEAEAMPKTVYAVLAKGVVCPGEPARLRVTFGDWTGGGGFPRFSRDGRARCATSSWALVGDAVRYGLPAYATDTLAGTLWLATEGRPELHARLARGWYEELDLVARTQVQFGCGG
ncbi:MAG: hypothetical protein HYV09_34325 [Deltaproteobacteria bacterium]|nr:hypothetical protein [Deltaproteobacteria bacterium]